jgi:hypothetical protein
MKLYSINLKVKKKQIKANFLRLCRLFKISYYKIEKLLNWKKKLNRKGNKNKDVQILNNSNGKNFTTVCKCVEGKSNEDST